MAEFHGKSEDNILFEIENGKSIAQVAREIGVDRAALSVWLRADPQRSARARDARERAADAYDELAEAGIAEASGPFELAKAKEIAHHLRWRASKIAPRRYGDKLELGGSAENPLTVVIRKLSEEK